MTETKITCEGGGCGHHSREHHALWPVIRSRLKRNTAGGCVALQVPNPRPFFYSRRHNATRVHRTVAMATVWCKGKLVMLGARGLCGGEQCSAVPSTTIDVAGLTPCPRCEFLAGQRVAA